jgi:hypothetical protein
MEEYFGDKGKAKRVLELEQRIEADKFDVDAWMELLRRAGALLQVGSEGAPTVPPPAALDITCATLESFLAVFPTSVSAFLYKILLWIFSRGCCGFMRFACCLPGSALAKPYRRVCAGRQ